MSHSTTSTRFRSRWLLVLAALVPLTMLTPATAGAPTPTPTPSVKVGNTACPAGRAVEPGHARVLAHYYIWFNASSWSRAKIDYPLAGRYSSDQRSIMEEQILQAQAAGITGFIVSWKSTPALNSRLATLARLAVAHKFQLAITYQGQDFNKRPLPVAQIRKDLALLAATYANNSVFHIFGDKPLVALSGTWNYTAEELRSITTPVRSKLLVLATEKDVEGYERVAPMFDGDLYYWSSADPHHTPGYRTKLLDMSNAVHARCGMWIAPVSPGFNAKAVGGTSIVDRRNGATLRSSWAAALATAPEAIGLISWNEFSENTHIEPSVTYKGRYLDVLRALTHSPAPPPKELDSDGPQGPPRSASRGLLAVVFFVLAIVGVGVVGAQRSRNRVSRVDAARPSASPRLDSK
jgi:hypothetical protein